MRNILTKGGTYDQHRKEFQKMGEAAFIASTTLPSAPGKIKDFVSLMYSKLILNYTKPLNHFFFFFNIMCFVASFFFYGMLTKISL